MRSVAYGVAAVLWTAGAGNGAEEYSLFAHDAAHAPHVMYYAGGDLWHTGAFVHGGLLWSPGGLFREGFTLKLLGGGGTYRYLAGGVGGVEVRGVNTLGAIMPGWRLRAENLETTLYGGLDFQSHTLSPDDPGNRMRGSHFGARVGADIWYEPFRAVMLAANASVSTIGPNYWTRIAGGWRAFDRLWLGPEIQALGGATQHHFRAGVHATSFRTGPFEWSAGVGYGIDTDRRRGLYARVGVLARR
jgi:hypothetical protein